MRTFFYIGLFFLFVSSLRAQKISNNISNHDSSSLKSTEVLLTDGVITKKVILNHYIDVRNDDEQKKGNTQKPLETIIQPKKD